jgi:hypothetical protein
MNDLARAIVIAAFLLGGALIVRGTFGTDRYELVQAGAGQVYRLDRLTGAVTFCNPLVCRPLPTVVPNLQAPPQGAQPAPQPAPQQGPSPAGKADDPTQRTT